MLLIIIISLHGVETVISVIIVWRELIYISILKVSVTIRGIVRIVRIHVVRVLAALVLGVAHI